MLRRLIPYAAAALTALLTAIAATVATLAPAGAATAATATFTKGSDWGTGWEGKYTVTAGSAALASWKVEFDLPSGTSVGAYWDADLARSGTHYTFTGKSWNASLAAGASVSFGFNGTGPYAAPSGCKLNGQPCDGSGTDPDPTITPTVTPTVTPTDPPAGGMRKVAYFTQWGIYGRNYKVVDVERSGAAAKLTHINYAFGNVNEQGRCFETTAAGTGDAWADYQRSFAAAESVDGVGDTWDQPLRGNFNQLKELKAKHPGLKVMMSLGGWTWSKYFSNAALTASSRQAFAQSCIDLFIKGNLPAGDGAGGPGSGAGVFDGIDIDWEWPGSEGNTGNVIRPEDKQNFTLLLQELRRQLDAYGASVGKRYEMSAFLPAAPAKIAAGIEVSRVFSTLDFATVQGYDFHGSWEPQTNHQSQLRSPAGNPAPVKYSVDGVVTAYLNGGAPAQKIVVGVPAYGRGWQGVPSANNGLYQSSSGAAPGTWEAGNEDYKVLKNKAGTRFRDSANGALWLYDGNQFWSYDDPQLLTQKGQYIKSKGLGGSMLWSLDGDDAQASLTTALSNALN